MSDTAPQRPARIFGVCTAMGEDFGFHPDWLRVAFAGALLFALKAMVIAYAAVGAIVLASRLLFPEAPTNDRIVDVSTEEAEQEWRKAA